MFGRIHQVKLSGPGLLLVGRFLVTDSISLLVIGLFRLSVTSWFNLGRLYDLGIYPFLLCRKICWQVMDYGNLLRSFVVLWYQL